MAIDNTNPTVTATIYRDDRGGSNLIEHPVLAVVKDNIDSTHSGKIKVYIPNYGGIDPDDYNNWIEVRYMSPWFGVASSKSENVKNPKESKYGEYVGNPVSYGMWASAPDIGTEVICIFVNGRPNQGFYIGSPPVAGIHHMVPAIGSASAVVPNKNEAQSYGDATRLPVSEVNINDSAIKNSRSIYNEPKPIHSYQAAILNTQGLIRDNIRGTISSSSQRETPSRVFGISTPGGTIYQGGYNNKIIQAAINEDTDTSKLQIAGRTGGHSIVMDDGTISGEDQLMRIRTSAGHTIMMNDSGQNIFIIHSNGLSWIELNKEGAIDVYSTNSFNVRTQGDINMHADRDINMHAQRNLKLYGNDIKIEADLSTTLRTGTTYSSEHGGKYSVKTGGDMSLQSIGSSSLMSFGTNYINGIQVKLNSGIGPTSASVPVIDKTSFDDTIYSSRVGWMYPSPKPLLSITSRVTTHFPFKYANTGINLKINQVASSGASSPASAAVQAVTGSVPSVPSTPIDTIVAATAPITIGLRTSGNSPTSLVDSQTVAGAISQQSATFRGLSNSIVGLSADAKITSSLLNNQITSTLAKNLGSASPIPGAITGLTLNQASLAGVLKPGSASVIAERMAAGIPFSEAGALAMSGINGLRNPLDLVDNVTSQINTMITSMQSGATSLSRSVFTGTESATQITGLISAASNYGVTAVDNILQSPSTAVTAISSQFNNTATGQLNNLNNIGAKLSSTVTGIGDKINGIQDIISGGNFAANIQDGIGNAFNSVDLIGSGIGLVASFLGGGSKSTVQGILADLRSKQQAAFSLTERSFGTLKAGVPNSLGNYSLTNTTTDSQTDKFYELENAIERSNNLDQNLLAAKKAYRLNPNTENYAKLISIENLYFDSRRILEKSKDSVFRVTAVADKSPSDSNLLDLRPSVITDFSGAIKTLRSIDSLKDSEKFAGDLIGNVKKNLDLIGGNVSSAAESLSSKLGLSIGSIGTGGGSVKTPETGSNTFNFAPVNTRTAQLLDDPIIPMPIFDSATTNTDSNKYLSEQLTILNKIQELNTKQTITEQRISSIQIELISEPGSSRLLNNLNDLNIELEKILVQISAAQIEYNRLIS